MGITGICLYSLLVLMFFTAGSDQTIDRDTLVGGIGLAALYGLALSIVALIQSNRLAGKIREASGETHHSQQKDGDGKSQPQSPVGVQPKRTASPSFDEELRRLSSLKQDGILTEEEFSQKKKTLLGL